MKVKIEKVNLAQLKEVHHHKGISAQFCIQIYTSYMIFFGLNKSSITFVLFIVI